MLCVGPFSMLSASSQQLSAESWNDQKWRNVKIYFCWKHFYSIHVPRSVKRTRKKVTSHILKLSKQTFFYIIHCRILYNVVMLSEVGLTASLFTTLSHFSSAFSVCFNLAFSSRDVCTCDCSSTTNKYREQGRASSQSELRQAPEEDYEGPIN